MKNTAKAVCRIWEDGSVDLYYATLAHDAKNAQNFYKIRKVFELEIEDFLCPEEMEKMKKEGISMDTFIAEYVSDIPSYEECGTTEEEVEKLLSEQ